MSWTYKVLNIIGIDGCESYSSYGICEEYIIDGGRKCHTSQVSPTADTIDDLIITLERMIKAAKEAKQSGEWINEDIQEVL